MSWLAITFGFIALVVLGLLVWRLSDAWMERTVWSDLLRLAGSAGTVFDPSAVEELPEPAQRYFRYAIAPGTRLVSVVEIEMAGELGLGTKDKPGYRPMRARQVLAPPKGLVWRLRAGPITGSDGAAPDTSWTRFWLLHLVPVVRVSGNSDHQRSAFGRVVAEGAFWVPSSLLPGKNVSWSSVSEDTARATVLYGGHSQSIDLTVEANGQPSRIVIQRWSDANAEKVYREQPFGGYLSSFREIGGYRLPMRVEGGNLIGTEDYFPFFKAEVRAIRFPQLAE
jgi:Family of unknown function (DUF6544)